MIEIDNKSMWENILRFSFEVKAEDIRNNPVETVVKFIGDSIKHALNEQGLEYKNGEIVSNETEKEEYHCTGIGSKKATGKLREMLDNIDEESFAKTREKM